MLLCLERVWALQSAWGQALLFQFTDGDVGERSLTHSSILED